MTTMLSAVTVNQLLKIEFAFQYAAVWQPRRYYSVARYRMKDNFHTTILLTVTANQDLTVSGWVADINLLSNGQLLLRSQELFRDQTQPIQIGYQYISKVYLATPTTDDRVPTTVGTFAYGTDWCYARYTLEKLILG